MKLLHHGFSSQNSLDFILFLFFFPQKYFWFLWANLCLPGYFQNLLPDTKTLRIFFRVKSFPQLCLCLFLLFQFLGKTNRFQSHSFFSSLIVFSFALWLLALSSALQDKDLSDTSVLLMTSNAVELLVQLLHLFCNKGLFGHGSVQTQRISLWGQGGADKI